MRRRHRRNTNSNLTMKRKPREIVEFWVLKILIDLHGTQEFIDVMRGFSDDSIAYFLGLGDYVDEFEEKDKKEILVLLKEKLLEMETKASLPHPGILMKNISKVTNLINLNSVESDILIFTVYLKYYDLMDNATRLLDDLSTDRLITALSVLLEYKPSKIKKALSPQSRLARSGLVTIDRDGSASMNNKFDIISRDFAKTKVLLSGDDGWP